MTSRGQPIGVLLAGLVLLVLAAPAHAQPDADKAPELIATLRELITEHEIEHYLPDEPVRLVFETWGIDARTDRLVEHPELVSMTVHGPHVRIQMQVTMLRNGELFHPDFGVRAFGPDGTWEIRGSTASIEDSNGPLAEHTRQGLRFRSRMLSRAFRQGLTPTRGRSWEIEILGITGDAWTAVLSSPDVKYPLRIEGRGLTHETVAIERISFPNGARPSGDNWTLYTSAGDHVRSPWSPRMIAKHTSLYDPNGNEVSRVVIRDIAIVPHGDFLTTLRPPDPQNPPPGVVKLSDSRGFVARIYDKDWTNPDEAAPLILTESHYQIGRFVLIGSGLGAAVAGVVAAIVVAQKLNLRHKDTDHENQNVPVRRHDHRCS
jgi:hypothetical protein